MRDFGSTTTSEYNSASICLSTCLLNQICHLSMYDLTHLTSHLPSPIESARVMWIPRRARDGYGYGYGSQWVPSSSLAVRARVIILSRDRYLFNQSRSQLPHRTHLIPSHPTLTHPIQSHHPPNSQIPIIPRTVHTPSAPVPVPVPVPVVPLPVSVPNSPSPAHSQPTP
ncbi:hypothetical protein K439DRAFT_1635777 [Ramaria rubella]|nr:hypothetical protein K439DRAFT_1635777 [Ramaria rubella]